MYLAEFSFPGTTELVNDLLIQAPSEVVAKSFAQEYAAHWEMELFSLSPITEQQIGFYHLRSKTVAVAAA